MKTLTTLKILKMILTSMLMTAILKTQALSVKDLKRKIRLPALAAAADVVDGMMTWRKHSYVNVCIVAVLGLKCWSCLLSGTDKIAIFSAGCQLRLLCELLIILSEYTHNLISRD